MISATGYYWLLSEMKNPKNILKCGQGAIVIDNSTGLTTFIRQLNT